MSGIISGVGDKVENRNTKLVGGALAYVMERLTEDELIALCDLLTKLLERRCDTCGKILREWT